ncbi:three-Cys-motif partner protein TcmP [Limnothrix sp. FACHB-708]|uniref:three-Cys-motif partner protein TcmP n=1 Tax=unclassified Limnothrix TaxID=2632864 RepID=UPI0016868601|nr:MULTISPECIES: three-Cys-motif partner protein TcmP [unclassified Limnothrix]MBD2554346.1 three-Cys-motif partner protein TcmP [Limnothrix sp. FACHB-708]MBD2591486.1 three-Cys-motif partner protein TcmP [Limnothrix sp. FACHB-406]
MSNSSSQSSWSRDGQVLPNLEPHTRAKHQILEEYVENLVWTLYGKARRGLDTFTFIDGFCGGGMYRDPETGQLCEGSPIRLIKAVERGCQKSQRQYPIDVKYIFIDSKEKHLECLKNFSIPQSGIDDEFVKNNCQFLQGEFEDLINSILIQVQARKGHSLFFLDPFGWSDVSMASIRKINLLSKSEIIYTYMIDFIARFIEELKSKSSYDSFYKVLEADGYYEEASSSKVGETGHQCYLRNESMRLFRDRGKAKYVFTFSMIPRGLTTRVMYYLIHMSNNLRALEVIKESFWKENTLDYQYYFEMYGFGFRTSDFYQENQFELQFDISKTSEEFCIEKLDDDLERIVWEFADGLSFRELCSLTMEKNPANTNHYIKYLNIKRQENDFEIIRNGKSTRSREIERSDIIRLRKNKQLFLFP